MRSNYLSIGEFSRYCNVSVMALRYYDEIGIIRPEYKDPQTGYRYYATHQLETISLVKSLKRMGMQLTEISAVLKNMNTDRYCLLMNRRILSIDEQIKALESERQFISRLLGDAEEARSSPKGLCYTKTCQSIKGCMYRCKIRDRLSLTIAMRALEKQLGKNVYAGSAFRIIAQSDLECGEYGEYSGLFLPEWNIPEHGADRATAVNYTLPGGVYAVIYSGYLHENAAPDWRKLTEFIASRGYSIAGDGYRYIPMEKGISNEASDYVACMAIPVRSA